MEFVENILLVENNERVCHFCHNFCVKGVREGKRLWWWKCTTCDVSFLTSLRGELHVIEFESKEENDKFYTAHLLIKNKKTDICAWTKDKVASAFGVKLYNQRPSNINKNYYTQNLVISFNQVLDITPTNFQNKLKTILIFL